MLYGKNKKIFLEVRSAIDCNGYNSSLVSRMAKRRLRKMSRSIDQIEEQAVKWWPRDLSRDPRSIQLLVDSQDKFLSLIKVSRNEPQSFLRLIQESDLAANHVLKHLCLLADYGGERIKRLAKEFKELFPAGELQYSYEGRSGRWKFSDDICSRPESLLSNPALGLDGEGMLTPKPSSPAIEDLIVILCYAGFSTNTVNGAFESATISQYFGKPSAVELFVRTRYIYVSKITSGELTNARGQAAQQYAADELRELLGTGFIVDVNGKIPLKDHKQNKNGLPFDLVVKRKGVDRFVGIEVSFQVTTNSVVERKAREAPAMLKNMRAAGHYVAYIVDGVGNFQRRNAWKTITENSDFSCAFKLSEFKLLSEFIKRSI